MYIYILCTHAHTHTHTHTQSGDTALELAELQGHDGVVAMLKEQTASGGRK